MVWLSSSEVCGPKFIVPRQSRDTTRPSRPTCVYSMSFESTTAPWANPLTLAPDGPGDGTRGRDRRPACAVARGLPGPQRTAGRRAPALRDPGRDPPADRLHRDAGSAERPGEPDALRVGRRRLGARDDRHDPDRQLGGRPRPPQAGET